MPSRLIGNRLDGVAFDLAKLSRSLRRPVECRFIEALDLVVQDHVRKRPDPFVLQIGANVGGDYANNVIRKYRMRGLLVEPLPAIFRQLVESYADQPQLRFVNCVVSGKDGDSVFYTVRSDLDVPSWVSEVASLDRRQVSRIVAGWRKSHPQLGLPADMDRVIQPLQLPALTITTLMQTHAITDIDLLIIDAMGFDYEILKLFPFERVQPAIIQFEHSLLSPADQHASYRYLAERGYGFLQVAVDTIAYLGGDTRPGRFVAWPKA